MRKMIGSREANLDFVPALAVLMVVVSHLAWFFGNLHVGFLQPALFGKLYHAFEHPMILIGNKAAAPISRKKILVKAQAVRACGIAR